MYYKEEVNGEVTKHHRFVYDNYLCVQKLDALNNNSQLNLFVWDPTEPIATRPLFMVTNPGNYKLFYTFDGNKNVSELVHFEPRNGIAAHYDYAPFGAVTRAVNTSAISVRNFSAENPFRFSSEYHDDTLGLVYYNYRHYNPIDGRWCCRDFIDEKHLIAVTNIFSYVKNTPLNKFDFIGLEEVDWKGYTVRDMPPADAKKGMGAYTSIVPWTTHELMFVDAICTQVGECHECVCPASSVDFKVGIDKDASWVLRSDLTNASLRQHEQKLFNIALNITNKYNKRLDEIKGYASKKVEIVAQIESCEMANNKIKDLFAELRREIDTKTMAHEERTNFRRSE